MRIHLLASPIPALDEAFEARFNADGSWREPPIPADRLVAAGQAAEAVRDCLDGLPPIAGSGASCSVWAASRV